MRGKDPDLTAVTSAPRATRGDGGIRSTSAPARTAWTATRPGVRPRVTPAIRSESVTTSPPNPSSSRSRPGTTWREIEDRYRVSLFMKNIGNVHYMQSLTAVAALFNFIQDNNPRTYGVKVQFDF